MQATQIIKLKDKLPRVVWHPSGRQYASRIGFKRYQRNEQTVRDRAFQLLGKDYTAAMQRAISVAADWAWTVRYFKESRPGVKPFWLRDAEMRAYQAADRGDLDGVYRTGVTPTHAGPILAHRHFFVRLARLAIFQMGGRHHNSQTIAFADFRGHQ